MQLPALQLIIYYYVANNLVYLIKNHCNAV